MSTRPRAAALCTAVGNAEGARGTCSLTCGRTGSGGVSCIGNIRPKALSRSQYEIWSKENGEFHNLIEIPLDSYEEDDTKVTERRRRTLVEQAAVPPDDPLFTTLQPRSANRRLTGTNNIMDIMVVYMQRVEDALGSADVAFPYITGLTNLGPN